MYGRNQVKDYSISPLWCAGSGRSILNVEDIKRQLISKYGDRATVTVTYVEVETLHLLAYNLCRSLLMYIPYEGNLLTYICVLLTDHRAVTHFSEHVDCKMTHRQVCRSHRPWYVDSQGMTLQQQAAVFNSASILILMQGAAMANFQYLAVGAVGIHIKHNDKHYEIHDWPRELVISYSSCRASECVTIVAHIAET